MKTMDKINNLIKEFKKYYEIDIDELEMSKLKNKLRKFEIDEVDYLTIRKSKLLLNKHMDDEIELFDMSIRLEEK
jgi:cytidylate kinase